MRKVCGLFGECHKHEPSEDDLMIVYRCACGDSWVKQKLDLHQMSPAQKDRMLAILAKESK